MSGVNYGTDVSKRGGYAQGDFLEASFFTDERESDFRFSPPLFVAVRLCGIFSAEIHRGHADGGGREF